MISFIKNLTQKKDKEDFFLQLDDSAPAPTPEAASTSAETAPAESTAPAASTESIEAPAETEEASPTPAPATSTAPAMSNPAAIIAAAVSKPTPMPGEKKPEPTFAPQYFGTTTTFKKRKAGGSMQMFREMANKVGR
ncbi:MAG: hypothetical protein ACPGVO_19350 [Spirulinaceae cyanobacterium]